MSDINDLNDEQSSLESLEGQSTVVEPSNSNPKPQPTGSVAKTSIATSPALGNTFMRRLIGSLNVYLLSFLLILLLTGVAGTLFYLKARSQYSATSSAPSAQPLSQSALDALANSDVTVGEPKHTLEVQSNADFAGSVLMRSNLQVAGTLQVGSNLAINGIRVTGNSTFDDVQVTKSIAVTGNGSIQGQLNVQQNLNVNGGGTFQGVVSAPSLIAGSLQLNQDLTLTHHLTAGGITPGRTTGSALGSGGTVSVSGSDTAGSITINTGNNPGVGCFITVNFTTHFNSTPHIVITPVGSSAAGLAYYINRSTNNFGICTTSVPPSNTTFGYDYIAFD